MNDYVQHELSELMQDSELMADLVDSYHKKAEGKKMIVFAVNIEHSRQIVEKYRQDGISAEHIDANTPKKEREQILQKFRNEEILVLSNVDIVSEEGIVLDNAGLWLEHGFCQQNRVWTLEGKKKRKHSLGFSPMVAAIDNEDIIREVHIPQEIKGMELVELTKETEELLQFELYLSIALDRGHKPLSAYYKFDEYLSQTGRSLNSIHLKYIQNRLSKLPEAPKEGMWYHIKQDRGLT